jgi:hypothetical protein
MELDLSTIITIICFILSEMSPFITNHRVNGFAHFVLMLLHKFLSHKAEGETNEQAIKETLEETIKQ